ncbi:hypothetical protein PFISCL1PPCAC_7748, partial [Pristionchus fissidentatus]
PIAMSDIFAGNTPKSIIFETFPSLTDLRLSNTERELKQRRSEEKLLLERREEKEAKGYTKVLATASAVKQNPSMPLPDFAAELTPKQIVEALNNGAFANTKKRVEVMVEDRLLKLFEEEKLINSALLKEMTTLAASRSEDSRSAEEEKRSAVDDPRGLISPTPLTTEDMEALKSIKITTTDSTEE